MCLFFFKVSKSIRVLVLAITKWKNLFWSLDRKCSWSSPPSTFGERPVKQLQRLSKFAQYFSEKRGNLPTEKSTFFIPGEPEYYKHLRLFWNYIKIFWFITWELIALVRYQEETNILITLFFFQETGKYIHLKRWLFIITLIFFRKQVSIFYKTGKYL